MQISILRTISKTKLAFIILTAFYILHAVVRWLNTYTGRIATHFSTDGTPNDSMTGIGFALFHIVMAAFLIGIRWFIAASARGQQGVKLPSGYYEWSISEKQAFIGFIEEHSWKFGCLLMGMFIAIDGLIFWANAQTPANLPLVIGLMLTLVFLGGMGWWIIRMLSEVQRIKKQEQSR
jgi:hypothetical protein